MIEWYWYCIKFLNSADNAFTSMHHEISYFLPIDIKLEIDGIGGLQYGNTFMTDYIPDQYKDHTLFQIGQIEHRFTGQSWNTSFQGLMRMKPIKQFTEEIEETTDAKVKTKDVDEAEEYHDNIESGGNTDESGQQTARTQPNQF